MEWVYAKHSVPPAHFRDVVYRQHILQTLQLSLEAKAAVLDVLQEYFGQRWVEWRAARWAWLADYGAVRQISRVGEKGVSIGAE